MPTINQITHPDNLVQTKVNFFADYFNFVTVNIGLYDELEIENHLSLIEKVIFQIENNLAHCPKYLDCYFSHPILKKENKYFKEFKQYQNLQSLIQEYQKAGPTAKKVKWIKNNAHFLSSLLAFKKELNRNMFKSALKAIISFLKCKHDLAEHIDDLKYYTNVLVSEFLLNDRTKKDINRVFERIMTRETSKFPFPKSLIEIHKGKDIDEAKKEFIEKRTFDQQFDGIYNILKEKDRKHYFLFRVTGINAKPDFHLKYNKVTFYHPEHAKLKEIRMKCKSEVFLKDFFGIGPMIIASVKIDYYSSEIAEQEAITAIKNELEFLNHVCGVNAHIEKFSFLKTSDFKNVVGSRRSMYEKGYMIGEIDEMRLEDNPFIFLRRVKKECRNHFLEYEPLFIKAMTSHSMPDYWHYLEALIPTKDNNEKQIIDVVSSLLVLNTEKNNKSRLRNYITNAILPFGVSADVLGITRERQMEYYNQIGSRKEIDFNILSKEITHPFLHHLLKIHSKPYKKPKLKAIKEYYSRILWELQAQRNAIVHTGYGNENAMILLNGTLPFLITRFRWVLLDGMKNNKEDTFEELINNLKNDTTV